MKASTAEQKLLGLLGLSEKVKPSIPDPKTSKKSKTHNSIVAVPESEIQKLREAQGIYYFLQAPELFQPRVCKHCDEPFLVSRMFVAFCSYTCIKKDLENIGIHWDKDKDLEAYVQNPNVYDGNEPIWIRNIDRLMSVIQTLNNLAKRKSGMPT